jgi:hypothetical protein
MFRAEIFNACWQGNAQLMPPEVYVLCLLDSGRYPSEALLPHDSDLCCTSKLLLLTLFRWNAKLQLQSSSFSHRFVDLDLSKAMVFSLGIVICQLVACSGVAESHHPLPG